jgi:hypothetical protein
MAESSKEERAQQSRRFIISVMLMFLVSIVVFVVGTYFFVIPRLIALNVEVAALRAQLAQAPVESELPPAEMPEAPLTPEEVKRRLQDERLAFQECADSHLNGQTAEVVLSLRVAKSGQVEQASLSPTQTAGTPFGRCMLDRAKTLTFQSIPEGGVELSLPFSFKKVDKTGKKPGP